MAAALLDLAPHSNVPQEDAMSPGRPATFPAPAALDRLVLTGFMGSGKTTIGEKLAQQLGWRFVDLDHEIERRDGRAVPQIFAADGEAHFRRLESAALASVLGHKRAVVALGGGALDELGNRLLLEQSPRTAVLYLEAPFEELVARCLAQPDATARPNLLDQAAARQRFDRRRRHYERAARFRVVTGTRTVEQTLADVLAAIG